MSDEVIRIVWTVPAAYDQPHIAAHLEENARRAFADELLKWVTQHQGGIVSPIHYREETFPDFFTHNADVKRTVMYAHVTELPEPPDYRLMGGPADGYIVRTGGAHTWRVPMAPSMREVTAYGETPEATTPRHAEYQLVQGTQTYVFRGVHGG